jgi:tripartite-type tricarboxylate transporter receptor subunit TctC
MPANTIKTALVALWALGALLMPAGAQDYPTRAIRFVVPFAAGSATDTLARILAQKLASTEGWSIVVENMGGASGMLAAQNVARAAPDGYTVFVTTNTTHAANQSLFKQVPYDAINDFEPVSQLCNFTLALALQPSVPAATVRELVAYGKANPGKLTFGSGSSSARIAGEMLKVLGGFDMLHVPYKSNPQAMTDLLGGQISMMFADVVTTLPQIRNQKVKGLAVSSAQRSPLAPDLPTVAEAGVPGYELTAWAAAFVPAKTPKPVVEKLHAGFAAALADKAVQEALLKAGIEPASSTPDQLRAFVASEIKKWADIVKAAGIQPE